MQQPSPQTVLGDFDDASFTHNGVASHFTRDGPSFKVRTEGEDGRPADFVVAWVFGFEPLQQYLVDVGGGRVQVLQTAWDTRTKANGGQRWFHLYPDEAIPPGDSLHWTGRDQNWNYMCAECHSTHVRKGYDPDTDTYDTRSSELDVACESCHGPASRHLAWAENPLTDSGPGLVSLRGPEAAWIMDPQRGIATRSAERTDHSQTETCARCHSRRSVFSEDYRHGAPLLDTHRLSLLEEPLYYADGQIRDEVYVHGSFLQSRMYAAGVTCSDCHDPHSLTVRGRGNDRCAGCHLPERFDTTDHHHHGAESQGSHCVECHMPSRTYMGIDERRDHSFRIPRPGLSASLGSPSACASCHEDRLPGWAAERVAAWRGDAPSPPPHYGEVLRAARDGATEATEGLQSLILGGEAPGIVRATATALLTPAPNATFLDTIRLSSRDPDALVRLASLTPLTGIDPQSRFELAGHLLEDPIRAVRIEAARVMADIPANGLPSGAVPKRDAALAELRGGLLLNSDRPESWLNLGLLEVARGDLAAADAAYVRALALDGRFVPAIVNLADLRRQQNRDAEGEALLQDALGIGDTAEVRHALGLLLVRGQRLSEALEQLELAARAAPSHPRYGYVFGIALESAGRVSEALETLSDHHRRHPSDPDTLVALATLSRKHARPREALAWAERLLALNPTSPGPQRLVQELQAGLP
ncbi:MAG: multiheme c-type cytochrome [Acidobacteriota bacterium]|nr:multiheme c-type cytochrome [Acidobacteriota bacterium]